ncbi:MAG: signal peptidase II [Anaerolineae bacterium]|nr:signal peptidase II [Anaerolineae bacterium]
MSAPPRDHSLRPAPRIHLGRWLILLISAALVIGLDQTSKRLATAALLPGESITPIPALAEVFAITVSHNTGAAFSLLPQAGDMFLIIGIAMIIGILLFYRYVPPGHWPERLALGLLLGGTLGNALDRLQYGYVVDWVHLRIPGVISNVSNFADHAIVLGIAILVLGQWLRPGPSPDEQPDAPITPAVPSVPTAPTAPRSDEPQSPSA